MEKELELVKEIEALVQALQDKINEASKLGVESYLAINEFPSFAGLSRGYILTYRASKRLSSEQVPYTGAR